MSIGDPSPKPDSDLGLSIARGLRYGPSLPIEIQHIVQEAGKTPFWIHTLR